MIITKTILWTEPAFFTDQFSSEVSGNVSFVRENGISQFTVSPRYTFFPLKYLNVGTKVDFSIEDYLDNPQYTLGFGLSLGFAYGNIWPRGPFVSIGFQRAKMWMDIPPESSLREFSAEYIYFPDFAIGIKVPVLKHIGINLEVNYFKRDEEWRDESFDQYWNSYQTKRFAVVIGISGLIY